MEIREVTREELQFRLLMTDGPSKYARMAQVAKELARVAGDGRLSHRMLSAAENA